VVLLALCAPARGKLCGDDVDGADVPCACGDIVVSDLVIGNDPVARDTCAGDGLMVRAMDNDDAITIDLAGATLRGDGSGSGILALYGGPGGARIISSGARATIDRFRDGIAAHGSESLAVLENVNVTRSSRDGVRVHAENYQVRQVDVRSSGRDGFGIMGGHFRLADTLAGTNARNGYFIMGRNGVVGVPGRGVAARGNGAAGLLVGGDSHQIVDCIATSNNKQGVRLQGDGHEVIGCQTDENLGDGITGMGNRWRVGGNRAASNGGHGIDVRGPNLTDLGRNSGVGNGSLVAEPQTPVQCRFNNGACRE
jgi:hypothetical protein